MTPTFDVSLRFGPMLIGVFLNMILYGIMIVQARIFIVLRFWRFAEGNCNARYCFIQRLTISFLLPRDSLWLKLLVAYLFILSTLNSAFDMAMMYDPLISGFGSEEAFANFPKLFVAEPIAIALIACPIQCFFAWRIYRITGNIWIPCIVILLALASCGGGIWTGVMVGVIKVFARKPELHTPALVWFLTSCVADVIITATLVSSLRGRKTGFVVTDTVIDKIIRTTVQTGMITAVCAIGDVVFFMALGHTALNFIWDLMLSKLYTNCLLSTLNSRTSLQALSAQNEPSSFRNGFDGGLSSRENRRQTHRNGGHSQNGPFSSAVFELDNTKSYASSRDLEYGITVTKVVEQLEDPKPASVSPVSTTLPALAHTQ
ncbi:hypothetical protein L218DRAFT_1004261 [Marasmius fiardii PR-910]|nr:hypothetical protein L218DRAFT_1004261 [Marasmius fiardii PR-910]